MAAFEQRKLSVLAAFVLVVLAPTLLAATWAVQPIWQSLQKARSDTDLVRRLRATRAEEPVYRAALEQEQKAFTGQNVLFTDGSAELASARLQSILQELVMQVDGQMQSNSIASPETVQGLQELSVSLSFTLPAARLPDFFTLISTEKPFLIVQAVDLRSTDTGTGGGSLDVQMQVGGFTDRS